MEIKKIQPILVILLFLTAFYFWTLPIQKNQMPFGDADAPAHFALGDYMAQTDQPIYGLPYYLHNYGIQNNNKLWYPPQYHTNAGISEILGGERIIPMYIFFAIASFAVVFSVYFLLSELFSPLIGFLSSLMLIFSQRNIMLYIFGLWPEAFAYFFTPLIIYCFYKYCNSWLDGNGKKIYLIFTFLFVIIQFLMHGQVMILSVAIIAVYTVLLWAKEKKSPINWKNIILYGALAAVLLIILAPTQLLYAIKLGTSGGTSSAAIGESIKFQGFTSLLQWYDIEEEKIDGNSLHGVPLSYYSYKEMHNGYWTIPFLILGILFLLYRRKRKDILLLSWLIAMYLLLHIGIFGIERAHRFLAGESFIFYPLAVIGIYYLAGFFKINDSTKALARYILLAVLFVVIIFTFAKPAYPQLRDAYAEGARFFDYQYKAAEWMKSALDDNNANVFVMGTIMYPKQKWFMALSMKNIVLTTADYNKTNHYLIDIPELQFLLKNPQYKRKFNYIDDLDAAVGKNSTTIYDEAEIKILEKK